MLKNKSFFLKSSLLSLALCFPAIASEGIFSPVYIYNKESETNKFILSNSDWSSIQRLTSNLLSLPQSKAELKARLDLNDNNDFDKFEPLLASYKGIHDKAHEWLTVIHPSMLKSAWSIVSYADDMSVYLAQLQRSMAKLADTKSEEDYKAVIKIAEILRNQSEGFEHESQESLDSFKEYKWYLYQQSKNLNTIQTNYTEDIKNIDTVALKEEITDFLDQVEILQKKSEFLEYQGRMIITYIWIPIAGWISAAVVAKVYGDEDSIILQEIKKLKNIISEDKLKLSLFQTYILADKSIAQSIIYLNTLSPLLSKVSTQWQKMSYDMDSVIKYSNRIMRGDSTLESLVGEGEVQQIIKDWTDLSTLAEDFIRKAGIIKK